MWEWGDAFEFNPFEVGNPMTLGLAEELLESNVNDCVDYLITHYGTKLDLHEFDAGLRAFDIDFNKLPKYMQEKFAFFELEY